SENDRPDSFPEKQLFLALDYDFAGEDLEKFVFNNAKQAFSIWLQGLIGTIIDYTLSRLKNKDEIFYNDLSRDPDLFITEGDYQFEVYRMMQKSNGNNWQEFSPVTNVYWIHYILLKIMNECYYKNINTKIHKETLKELGTLAHKILTHKSAVELVLMLNS
ncbi:putative serine/threonine-protein kinase haspin-like protein, partial [Armadillidium nasatum]